MRTMTMRILPAAAALMVLTSGATARHVRDHRVTQQTINRWKKTESNWGRWGTGDQRGTLNFITPAMRVRASRLVRSGISVSLSREIVPEVIDPDGGEVSKTEPAQQRMVSAPPKRRSGSSDAVTIAAHGYEITHFDALGHHLFDGRMYNGFLASEHVSMTRGLSRGSIAVVSEGVVTRGVLVDLPLLKGVPYLEPGTPIYAEDIEAWEKRVGVRIGRGDAVFIRTGRWERQAARGGWDVAKSAAGLDASVIPWLRAREIALMGSESALSVLPFPAATSITNPDDYLPVHNFALVALGMPLIDNADLGPLSREAARHRRYTFLLSVAPIRVRTGTGVPVNPIATF